MVYPELASCKTLQVTLSLESSGLNTIQVRCDDPLGECPPEPEDPDDDPVCPPAAAPDGDLPPQVVAYARNPFEKPKDPSKKANDRFSEITFCRGFFLFRNLGNAMAYGSGASHPILKSDLSKYEGRGNIKVRYV